MCDSPWRLKCAHNEPINGVGNNLLLNSLARTQHFPQQPYEPHTSLYGSRVFNLLGVGVKHFVATTLKLISGSL